MLINKTLRFGKIDNLAWWKAVWRFFSRFFEEKNNTLLAAGTEKQVKLVGFSAGSLSIICKKITQKEFWKSDLK